LAKELYALTGIQSKHFDLKQANPLAAGFGLLEQRASMVEAMPPAQRPAT